MGELYVSAPAPNPPVDLILESNHRVANNLSVLAATLRQKIRVLDAGPEQVARDEAVALLDDTVGKIIAVARLYRRFADHAMNGERDAHDVVQSVLRDLEGSGIYGDRLRLGALSFCHPCRLSAMQAFRLTLAISEIVTNAVKHAHPTGLPVELSVSSAATVEGGCLLQISDDGVGFPETFVEARDAGLGLKLIRTLVESAGGTLEVRSDSLGLVYAMRFGPIR